MFWVIWEPQMLILTLKSEFIQKIYNKKKEIWEKILRYSILVNWQLMTANSRTVMREELSLEFGEFLTLQSLFVMFC